MATLGFEDMAVGYGYPPSLEGLNGELNTGEWIHMHGKNGVGKTTLLKTFATFKKPLAGTLTWNDEPLAGLTRDAYRENIRYFGHERALFQDLTVGDNWNLFSALFGLSGTSDAQLAGGISSSRMVGRLSQGEQQRIELSALWPSDPTVLIMDEPFASLDDESSRTLASFLDDSRNQGRLVITASPQPVEGPDRSWELSDRGIGDRR